MLAVVVCVDLRAHHALCTHMLVPAGAHKTTHRNLQQLAHIQQEMERGNPVPPMGPTNRFAFRASPGMAPAEEGDLDIGARDLHVEQDDMLDAEVDALLMEEHGHR